MKNQKAVSPAEQVGDRRRLMTTSAGMVATIKALRVEIFAATARLTAEITQENTGTTPAVKEKDVSHGSAGKADGKPRQRGNHPMERSFAAA
jgi:hypothetical protein